MRYSQFLLEIQMLQHHAAAVFVWLFLQEETFTFVITLTTFYSSLMFWRGICWSLICIAFCFARWNRVMFYIPKVCSFVHSCPAFTSPFYLAFLFPPSFSFHFPLIFHRDVVNSFFQLMLHFVLSIAMWQKSQRHSMSGSTPPGTSFELS